MSFPVNVPGGGGGITQLTGGVSAGPGSGSVAAETVSLTKTVDCTGAGTYKPQVSITAFDGTYATVSGLAATGALVPGYTYANINPSLFGPALSGGGASITAFSTPLATITGLSGITSSMVGKYITFTGFTNGVNNGTFQIAAFISSSSVQITNSSAISPDSGATWSINIGGLDGLTLALLVDSTVLSTIASITNNEGLFEVHTTTSTSLITGDQVQIAGVSGNGAVEDINGLQTITVIDSTHFTIDGFAYGGYYVSGGTVSPGPTTLTLSASTNAASESALAAAISATWPTVTATFGTGYYGPNTTLILTGTTLGPTGSIYIGGGSANSSFGLFQGQNYTGTSGVNVGGQLPTALTLSNFSNAGNNGTFNVHSWVNSSTVTILNPSAVTPDSGTRAIFSTGYYNDIYSGALYGPALSGSAATITNFTTPLATVGGLTGMTPAIVGQSITFSSGFTNSGNLGTFTVVGYISSTSVTINNTSAVSPDSGGVWSVPVGNLDGTTLIIAVDGGSQLTLTLDGATNAASMAAFFAAIEALWPALTASPNPTEGSLILTENSLFGPSSSIVFGNGTANNYLGTYGTYTGSYPLATFAVSLATGSPPITGSSVLSLTGSPPSSFDLCTQSVGPFRCLVENTTTNNATFASANTPAIGAETALSVSSDGTVINLDTPTSPTPPAYIIGSYNGEFSGGSTAYISPSPNTPFIVALSGTATTPIGTVNIEESQPFYSLLSNQSAQPVTVTYGSVFSGQFIGVGRAALAISDGTYIWSFSSITADNGRAERYKGYLARRAATGANLVNLVQSSNNGGDVVWGTSVYGGPYNQGTPAPFVDGSFNTSLTDNVPGNNPITYNGNSGQDIGVLGNIVYVAGYMSGYPTLCAFSIGTGALIAHQTLSSYLLPNTLIAFKEVSDPTHDIGGPSDCVFVIDNESATTWSLNPNGGFAQNESYTGSWYQARGILILGDNSYSSVDGGTFYSSIGVWTDPSDGNIWAADVVNGDIGLTQVYSGGNQPQAICLDRETGNFWVGFQGSTQISLLNIDLTTGENLLTTVVSSFDYPSGSSGIDDLLFDGAYLWAISVNENSFYQMTPNGTVASSFSVQNDSNTSMTMTSDSRLYSDGSFIYLTGMYRNGNSVIARIDPGTGLPVEYFTFPVFSTRGMAFRDDDVFIATAPTINTSSTGSTGSISSSDTGTTASITGSAPNVTLSGLTGVYLGTVGLNVTLSGTFDGANDGTFPIYGPYGSPNNLTYYNPGATVPDTNNGSISWSISGATQFTDPNASWSSDVVGNYIYITDSSYPINNGFFQVVSWTSTTQIGIANLNAVDDPSGDLFWQMYGAPYGAPCGIQRLAKAPPGTDFGVLDSIIQTPAVGGWSQGMRLGSRVVEYTGYGSPTTFEISVNPLPGTKVLFVDKDGNSSTNPLTISLSSGTINGQSSCVLQGPYAFLEIEWDGAVWLIIRQSNVVVGVGGPRPPNPMRGQMIFDFNVGLPIWWNGSQWINAAGTPV